VKPAALLIAISAILFAQSEGNFNIRVEPRVVLHARVDIPVEIDVTDDLGKPVSRAKVTLQIETPEHKNLKVFRAPEVGQGQYIAKPVFPAAGEWDIYVEVTRNVQTSSRTTQFSVPD
jgi:nitrogen fixation protein FixH